MENAADGVLEIRQVARFDGGVAEVGFLRRKGEGDLPPAFEEDEAPLKVGGGGVPFIAGTPPSAGPDGPRLAKMGVGLVFGRQFREFMLRGVPAKIPPGGLADQ